MPICRPPECIQEATSEFISFITSEAADRATNEKRKTITGDDILYALKTLGFDEMSEVLLIYLAKYREVSGFALGSSGKVTLSDPCDKRRLAPHSCKTRSQHVSDSASPVRRRKRCSLLQPLQPLPVCLVRSHSLTTAITMASITAQKTVQSRRISK